MSNIARMMQRATAGAGGAGLDVDEVFSTDLWVGTYYNENGLKTTVNNGIDLLGEGGLVWLKHRTKADGHSLFDTARGYNSRLSSNNTNAVGTGSSDILDSFRSTGFKTGANATTNGAETASANSGNKIASWTFRKAKKFFDVVTWTGNGSAGRQIAHNLGTTVGMLVVKSTSHATSWKVQHRSTGATNALELNDTRGSNDVDDAFWNDTAASSTHFTVGDSSATNSSGRTYVAYLFAHHNNDGTFGPDGDQDVIKCGSYTGNGSTTGPVVNLGFEPQWLMIKNASTSRDWLIFDNMRGITTGGNDPFLIANGSAAEENNPRIRLTSTGFQPDEVSSDTNNNGETYIYMAIRRGPLAPPEDATEVFDVTAKSYSGQNTTVNSGFSTDFNMLVPNRVGGLYVHDRLRGELDWLRTSSTGAETTETGYPVEFDHQDGIVDKFSGGSNGCWWQWKRAPSFFDVVTYSGSNSTQNISHNLGVQPEMIWIKNRDSSDLWVVQVTSLGARKYLNLNGTGAAVSLPTWNGKDYFANTLPTASVFTVGGGSGGSGYDSVGGAGYNYIAYLFATVAGVSKVGSYTGNSSDGKQIDCGFSNGARFVLLKNTTVSNTNWLLFDTVRGIVSGNDARLYLNSSDSEHSSTDYIDPYSSGFALTANAQVNYSGSTYIFYAIA